LKSNNLSKSLIVILVTQMSVFIATAKPEELEKEDIPQTDQNNVV
jgi:hypothetical protein